MRLVWSDEPPVEFEWGPVRATVEKLVRHVGSGKTVGDVLQSREGGNTCSTRANGPMKQAWNAVGKSVSVRSDLGSGVWKSKDAARAVVEDVHSRAEQGRQQNEKVKVTVFSFTLADATQTDANSRFGGYHCLWLIDAGEEPNGGRLYFVAYDQDVTCTKEVEDKWKQRLGPHKDEEDVVNGWGLDTPDAKLLVEGMLLGGRDTGRLGPLIRFLYVVE